MDALTRYHALIHRVLYAEDSLAEFYALRNVESYETFKILCWHLKKYLGDSQKVDELLRTLRADGRHFDIIDEDKEACADDKNPVSLEIEYSKIRFMNLKNDQIIALVGLCEATLNEKRFNQSPIPKYFSFEQINHPENLANELLNEGFIFESQISIAVRVFKNQFKGNDPLIWRAKLRPFEFFIGKLSKADIIDPNDCWSFLKTHQDIFHIISKGKVKAINPKSLGKITEPEYAWESVLKNPVLTSIHILLKNSLGV